MKNAILSKLAVHYKESDCNWPPCGIRVWIYATEDAEAVTCKKCLGWLAKYAEEDKERRDRIE